MFQLVMLDDTLLYPRMRTIRSMERCSAFAGSDGRCRQAACWRRPGPKRRQDIININTDRSRRVPVRTSTSATHPLSSSSQLLRPRWTPPLLNGLTNGPTILEHAIRTCPTSKPALILVQTRIPPRLQPYYQQQHYASQAHGLHNTTEPYASQTNDSRVDLNACRYGDNPVDWNGWGAVTVRLAALPSGKTMYLL